MIYLKLADSLLIHHHNVKRSIQSLHHFYWYYYYSQYKHMKLYCLLAMQNQYQPWKNSGILKNLFEYDHCFYSHFCYHERISSVVYS
uniref:Ovule protein n=1 Tax=Schistosoma curassoni TaxID=6186 RepID=A0A183JI95_9TREM